MMQTARASQIYMPVDDVMVTASKYDRAVQMQILQKCNMTR